MRPFRDTLGLCSGLYRCNSYGFPGFRCFSFLINIRAFCRAYTWASLNGNVNRLVHQIEEATTLEELTLIQSKMLVLAGGHNLLREENHTYMAPAVPKSGRGGIAIAGGTSGSSQAASSRYAATSASSKAASSGEAATSGSSQTSSSGEAAPVGAASVADSSIESAGAIVAKPSSEPYFRLLQQTGKARAIAKSGRMQPQNKAAARPTIDCINDLQARRAKSKPPAVPTKARPSQPLQKVQPKTPPKHRPKQPSKSPPKHLLVVDDSDDDWGHWRSVDAGSVDGNVDAGSVDADNVVAAGSVDADSVVAAGNVDADSVDADRVDADNVVATCRAWADEELNASILKALQELAETKKTSIIARDKAASERPKWWKKRGTSSRGGSGTYLWPLYRRQMPQVGQCPGIVLYMPLKPLYELNNLQETTQGHRPS